MKFETPQNCRDENRMKTFIILVNSLLVLAQIIITLTEGIDPLKVTLLIAVLVIVLYQMCSLYFVQLRTIKIIYLGEVILTVILVEIKMDEIFLIFQQLAIFDILFICKNNTGQIPKVIFITTIGMINTYIFIRVYIKYSNQLIVFAILYQILLKVFLWHFKEASNQRLQMLQIETQKLNNHELDGINEKSSVPRVLNQENEENNFQKLFKAFDVLPEGIIIMDKSEKETFKIRYANTTSYQLFDTQIQEDMLMELLHLKGATAQKSEEQIYKYSLSYQSQQSVQKKSFNVMPKQQIMKASFKLSQQFIIDNQNYISQNVIQSHTSHDGAATFPPVQLFFPNVKYESFNHQNSPSIQYASSNRKMMEDSDQFITLLQQIWTQTLFMIREMKEKNPSILNQALYYFHESDVFVADVKKYARKQSLDLKVFSAVHESEPLLIIMVRDINHKNYIKLLQEHNSQKSKTLSFVSHEFRTPLNCIISMLESVIEDKVNMNTNDQQLIQSALDNSKYILNLSNDLLDLAQIKAGKFKINIQNFNLKNLLKECLKMFEIQAAKKNIQLNFYFDKLIPNEFYSDANRIRQITVNLIGNAMKFTLEGSITIRAIQDGPNDVFIEVKDTGVGMREEDQPKLIKAFSKIENKETSQLNAQGVGLGLLISNSIVAQLNDESKGLGFHSVYQTGTTFCFLISNKKPSNYDEVENCEDSNREVDLEVKLNDVRRQSKQEKKFIIQKSVCFCPEILIVDDNQFNIDSFQLIMQRTFKPQIASDYTISGLLAEQKVQQRFSKQIHKCRPYRIIFMDVEMPFQNGIVTSRNIRSFYKTMNVPIIIVGCSGYVSEQEKQNCLECMDDYIIKPVSKTELERVMNTYFFN